MGNFLADPSATRSARDGHSSREPAPSPKLAAFLRAIGDRFVRVLGQDGLVLGAPKHATTRFEYWDTEGGDLQRAGFAAGFFAGEGGGGSFLEALSHPVAAARMGGSTRDEPHAGEWAAGEEAPSAERNAAFTAALLARHLGIDRPENGPPVVPGRWTCRITGALTTNERTVSTSSGQAGSIILEEGAFSTTGGTPRRLARVTIRAAREEDAARLREALFETCAISALVPLSHEGLFELLGVVVPDLVEPGPRVIGDELSTGEAALALVRGQLERLLANEPGVRLGIDPEAVHDMRVAVRRLRAAIQMYAPFLSPEIVALREPLRWAGNCLGTVRDLDVQQQRLRERQGTLPPGDAALLEPILATLASRRSRRHEEILDALASEAYRRIVTALTVAVSREASQAASVPVPLVAPAIVHEAARRFRKRRRALTKDSPASSFHKLRIRGKVLRYALEFHGSLYGEAAEVLVEEFTKLQDLLGAHQDATVAEDWFLSELENTTGPSASKTAFLLGRLAERSHDEARELRAQVTNERDPSTGRAWRRLERRMERKYHRVMRRAHEKGSTLAAPER